MIYAGEAKVFEMQVLDVLESLLTIQFSTLVRLQQSCQFLKIHSCIPGLHSKHKKAQEPQETRTYLMSTRT
jgi:hypothetical protein